MKKDKDLNWLIRCHVENGTVTQGPYSKDKAMLYAEGIGRNGVWDCERLYLPSQIIKLEIYQDATS